MNLEKLFKIMLDKNLIYFSGYNTTNMKEFDFSTGYNGRGNVVNIEIHNIPSEYNIDLKIYWNNKRFEYKSIDEKYCLKHIENNTK